MPEFEGVSEAGRFQEALEDAIKKALGSVQHTDPMASYVVKQIRGSKGGLAGLNQVVVTIETDGR